MNLMVRVQKFGEKNLQNVSFLVYMEGTLSSGITGFLIKKFCWSFMSSNALGARCSQHTLLPLAGHFSLGTPHFKAINLHQNFIPKSCTNA
jgi:hypothetical protein